MRASRLLYFSLVLAGCGLPPAGWQEPAPPPAGFHRVTVEAAVPPGTGIVYLSGNVPELGPWDPHARAMRGSSRTRTAVLDVPAGTDLELKFTLGSWDSEALGAAGAPLPGRHVLVDRDRELKVSLGDFKKDVSAYVRDWSGSGVLGRLEYRTDLQSHYLDKTRTVAVWLPPGYDTNPNTRCAVLYVQDGQNLFDPRMASGGVDWGVDEAIMHLVETVGMEPPIVVGVWNTADREREYSPWDLGPRYATFLQEELVPLINEKYRTLTGPENTSVMGASTGGLISFWLAWKHPEVFGRAACLSTDWAFTGGGEEAGNPAILADLSADNPFPKGVKVYLDQGKDSPSTALQGRVDEWLRHQGLAEGTDFVSRHFEGSEANEAAWRKRLDAPLLFLYGK